MLKTLFYDLTKVNMDLTNCQDNSVELKKLLLRRMRRIYLLIEPTFRQPIYWIFLFSPLPFKKIF